MDLQFPLTAIAVDDDRHDLNITKEVLNNCSFIKLVACFSDTGAALDYIKNHRIDIVFLDIVIGDENGIDFAITFRDRPLLVVFVTNHTEFAVQAFEVCAIDYILKPITINAVENTLGHLRRRLNIIDTVIQRAKLDELASHYTHPGEPPQRLFVNFVGETKILQMADIMYFTTTNRYTTICMRNGQKHISSKNIKFYEELIGKHVDFIRVHRSTILNKKFADKIITNTKENIYNVQMANGDILEVSRLRKDEVFALLLL